MTTTDLAPRGFVLKGWHVLAAFILFFGVDIAVNTVFMMSAYKTFPGETSLTPYEDGVAYNATLRQRRAQATLGWKLAAGVQGAGLVRVDASDRSGAPIHGLAVSVRLERPATESGERDLQLRESAPGVYTAGANGLVGAWDLDVTARDAAGHVASADRRLTLP
jgi:nitrogen fixation protein FixH